MNKIRLVSLVAMVLLLGGGALWLRDQLSRQNRGVSFASEESGEQTLDSATALVPSGSLAAGSVDREEAHAVVEQAPVEVTFSSAGLAIEPPPAEGFEFRVLIAADRSPVPGAVVSYFDWSLAPEGSSRSMGYDAGAHTLSAGKHYQADQEGVVRVPLPTSSSRAAMACQHEDLWGQVRMSRMGLPQDLWLYPNPTIEVNVQDVAGEPVPNAKVGLHYVLDESDGSCPLALRTDAQGRAYFSHLRQYTQHYWENTESLNLTLIGLWDEVDAVRLDPPDFPERVTLTMPAQATVNVTVLDEHGQPYEAAKYVSLRPRNRPELASWDGVVVSDCNAGRAVFAQVSPGMEFTARFSSDSNYSTKRVEGRAATEPGQSSEVILQLGEPKALLTGVALDAHGQPMGDIKLEAVVFMSSNTRTRSFVTDPDGTFRFDPGYKGDLAVRMRVVGPADLAAGELPESSLRLGFVKHFARTQGVQDLGQCQFQELPLLVSGQAVDEAGVFPGLVEVTATPIRSNSRRRSRRTKANTVRCDEDGHFAFYGWTTGSPMESKLAAIAEFDLRGKSPGYFSASQKVALGSRDVRLELKRSGSIEGSVILDENWHGGFLEVSTQQGEGRYRYACEIGDGGRFRVTSLGAGTYDFLFGVEDEPLSAVRIPGVVVKAGSRSEDARLWNVDLRGRLRILRLSAVRADGQELSRCSYYRRSSTAAGAAWHDSHRIWEPEFDLYTMYEDVDLQFHARDQKAETVRDVQGGERIVMQAGPRVHLTHSDKAIAEHPKYGSLYWVLASRDPELAPGKAKVTGDAGHGMLKLPMPGTYDVQMSMYENRRLVKLEKAVTTIQVQDTGELQEFSINMDVSEWLAMLEAKEKQAKQ